MVANPSDRRPHLAVTQDELQIVQGIPGRCVPQHEVWAFGSRIDEAQKPFSDLDLVVVSNKLLRPDVMAELRWAFFVSDLPWKVDVLDWSEASPEFRKRIRHQHVVWQAAA